MVEDAIFNPGGDPVVLTYEWFRGGTVNSLAASRRLRMYVTIPAGWRTLERVITHFNIWKVDAPTVGTGPPAIQGLPVGVRWMNFGAGLPDSDVLNNPTGDYIWAGELPFRDVLSYRAGSGGARDGWWTEQYGLDVRARRQMNTVDQYRAVVITPPLPNDAGGAVINYGFSGYQQVLVSRTV